MTSITYLEGDATEPVGDDDEPKIIAHCVNNVGGWGSGFVLALSNKWIAPEMSYRQLYETNKESFHGLLGAVQIVPVGETLWVANIFGQQGVARPGVDKPLVEEALKTGLRSVGDFARFHGASIHMPRIGCGLAGGSWQVVGAIIHDAIEEKAKVHVYDFPGGTFNP